MVAAKAYEPMGPSVTQVIEQVKANEGEVCRHKWQTSAGYDTCRNPAGFALMVTTKRAADPQRYSTRIGACCPGHVSAKYRRLLRLEESK